MSASTWVEVAPYVVHFGRQSWRYCELLGWVASEVSGTFLELNKHLCRRFGSGEEGFGLVWYPLGAGNQVFEVNGCPTILRRKWGDRHFPMVDADLSFVLHSPNFSRPLREHAVLNLAHVFVVLILWVEFHILHIVTHRHVCLIWNLICGEEQEKKRWQNRPQGNKAF